MASKRAVRRRRCEGKRRYATIAEAKLAAGVWYRRGDPMQAYRCPFCAGCHIGHRPASVWRAVESR